MVLFVVHFLLSVNYTKTDVYQFFFTIKQYYCMYLQSS